MPSNNSSPYLIKAGLHCNPDPYRILIVDDLGSMRTIMRRMIERASDLCDSRIIEAGCANTAVDRVKTFLPDVVLLDVNMPGRDGVDAIGEILDNDPMTRIIMVSASSNPEIVRRALLTGAKDFIVKPFNEGRLILSIKHAEKRPLKCH